MVLTASHELIVPNFLQQPTLEAQKDALQTDRHPWTIVHGFYAIMGGLAIHIPDNLPESKRFLPSNNSETWFLTPGAVRHLLRQESTHDDLPDLSTEEIKSKSKANGLAKALVCIQALWFIAQCITRRTLKRNLLDFLLADLLMTLCSRTAHSN